MAVNFSAELQRLARGMRTLSARVQNRAAVAKPRHASAVEQMCVNAGHLGGGVGAQAQGAAGELVDEFKKKGLQVVQVDRKSFQDAVLKNKPLESMGFTKSDFDRIQAAK